MDRDVSYFSRRASEERRAGMAAASEEARACHFELAAAYDEKVKELSVQERRSTLHIAS